MASRFFRRPPSVACRVNRQTCAYFAYFAAELACAMPGALSSSWEHGGGVVPGSRAISTCPQPCSCSTRAVPCTFLGKRWTSRATLGPRSMPAHVPRWCPQVLAHVVRVQGSRPEWLLLLCSTRKLSSHPHFTGSDHCFTKVLPTSRNVDRPAVSRRARWNDSRRTTTKNKVASNDNSC